MEQHCGLVNMPNPNNIIAIIRFNMPYLSLFIGGCGKLIDVCVGDPDWLSLHQCWQLRRSWFLVFMFKVVAIKQPYVL